MDSSDVPHDGVWTRRWWRIPGDNLLSQRVGAAVVNVVFSWCNEREWGLTIHLDRGDVEGFYDLDAEALVGFDDVALEVRRLVAEQLRLRQQQIRTEHGYAADPIIVALARRFGSREWTSGKRLRRETNLGIDEFRRCLQRLTPRYVRQSRYEEADEYSLTIPGLLGVEQLHARTVMEALYVAIASRFDADPDNEHFDTADLLRAGLAAHQLSLAKNVARVCLLIGAPPDSAKPNRFAMPADAEMIAESRRSGRSFLDYLLHAACEAKSNDHFAVKRPWPTAPLWIGRDGSQPDYVPIALLHEVTIPTEPEVTDLEAPERFEVPGFDLLDPLPAGASGEVYRAKENWDGGIERVVKIFVPHPFADDHDPEPRFRSEVQALYRLQHRAVVRYVTSGVLLSPRRAFYLVMEWVNGDRLSNRYQSMPFDTRVQTMIEILGGLHHAHQAKIFHRDVKPSNIMIRESDGQAVLVDFGLAYLVGDELDDDRTRQVLGTPGYIPPEVANNPKLSRDPRHDVFQAGVTLYEILVGRLPRENYITVESINPRLAALDPILQRAMSPLPETRYQSAQEFAQALAAWIEQDARAARAENSAPQTNAAPSFARAIELQSRQLREEQTEQQRRVEIVAAANRALAPTYEAIRSRLNAIAQAARDQGLPVSQAELVNEHPIEITLSALKEQTGSVRLFECHARPARGVPFAISLDCEYRPMLPAAWPLRFTLAINPGPDYPDNDVVHMLDGSPYTSWVRERTTNEHFPRLLEKWLDEPAHWAAFDVT